MVIQEELKHFGMTMRRTRKNIRKRFGTNSMTTLNLEVSIQMLSETIQKVKIIRLK